MAFVQNMEQRKKGPLLRCAVLKIAITLHTVKVVVGHIIKTKENFLFAQ
jgi:hypothetical protein